MIPTWQCKSQAAPNRNETGNGRAIEQHNERAALPTHTTPAANMARSIRMARAWRTGAESGNASLFAHA
eukprot:11187341-Lingulodinium_polyedra.AAC.1